MSAEAVRAAIALGSNLGDRRAHLDRARREIADTPGVRLIACSRWIETEPEGEPSDQPRYLNGALLVETTLAPRILLRRLLAIEAAHGRVRVPGQRNRPRTVDLDLLLYGAQRIDEPGLVVPHPRLAERAFVLQPLAEIAPDLPLPPPLSAQSVAAQLAELEARLRARAPG